HANELKDMLYSRKKELEQDKWVFSDSAETTHSVGTDSSEVTIEPEEEEAPKKLVHLNLRDLLLVGLTENHLRTGFIAVAFVFGTVSQYQEIYESYLEESVDQYAVQALNAGLMFALAIVVAFIV